MAEQKQGDQLEPTYSSSVKTRDIALRTYQKRSTIGRSGVRGSGISVLAVRQNDDVLSKEVLVFIIHFLVHFFPKSFHLIFVFDFIEDI